jgi:hypothetical protein
MRPTGQLITGIMALLMLVVPQAANPQVALATGVCPDPSWDRTTNWASSAEDGARVEWQLRTLDAPDWADDGHANTTLWVGTDGDISSFWVEVGVTDGYHGQNLYTYYMAYAWPPNNYIDYRIGGIAPVLGHVPQLRVFWVSGTVWRAEVYDPPNTTGISVSGNDFPVDEWHVGAEYTCPNDDQINKTYIVTNQFRRKSDGSWLNAPNGSLSPSGNPGAGIFWCSSPRTARFYLHSSIPVTGCS